jgi:GTP cyclohydrolase I
MLRPMNDMTRPLVPSVLHIPDTQSERDERHLAIQRVGVRSLRYPVQVQVGGEVLRSVGTWTLDVALPAERKGTHMSRFLAWLDGLDRPLDATRLRAELAVLLQRLDATEGNIESRFTFFMRKQAPVSGVTSLMDYQGAWHAEARAGTVAVWAEVVVPVKSLCPCSKEISDYGAHNQRSHVTIRAELLGDLGWDELVRFAEDSAYFDRVREALETSTLPLAFTFLDHYREEVGRASYHASAKARDKFCIEVLDRLAGREHARERDLGGHVARERELRLGDRRSDRVVGREPFAVHQLHEVVTRPCDGEHLLRAVLRRRGLDEAPDEQARSRDLAGRDPIA